MVNQIYVVPLERGADSGRRVGFSLVGFSCGCGKKKRRRGGKGRKGKAACYNKANMR